MKITDHLYHMKRHFRSGATRSIASRRHLLKQLLTGIQKHESDILAALHIDLKKPEFEAYIAEFSTVCEELKLALENLDEWAAVKHVSTPSSLFSSVSTIHPEPKGVVLIISPWNYPFNLLFTPLISAIAAGNVCVVKPSELSPATSQISVKILREFMPSDVVHCVEGDAQVSTELLRHAWDHVFFTGSTRVGKIVALACAEHLTPCTLELGGKSPCIVDQTANIKRAAKRIVWGKFINAGQTCVAPDYLLVHQSVKDQLIAEMRKQIKSFFGDDPESSPDFGRIINHTQYDRISALISSGSAIHGGRRNREKLYIEPTLIDGVTLDHPAMMEEIFGPVLPIVTWNEKGQLFTSLEANQNPLALYLFTEDQDFENLLISSIPFGGGCVNQTLLHLGNPELPFGGVRQSGLGSYHGRHGFETFTHQKSILKAGRIDINLKYPKYSAWKLKLARWWLE